MLARKKFFQARRSLAGHIEYREAGITPAPHHKLLIEHLEALERRDFNRLMVFMPPGSAKSSYASVEFPPWYMGRRPTENVIAASHTAELAEHFGRQVRNICASEGYERLWNLGVSGDSSAAGRWANTKGGQYFAVGVGGSVTGRRGNFGLIDDPVKGKEAADSETDREKVWNWYITDFLTRLKPDAVQLLIMTRWHEDDLAGRILEREADKWKVLCLPMEATENDPLGRKLGERLWSTYFTTEMVETAKRDSRTWGALYQQNPTPDDGTFFKREWFKRWGVLPELHYYISSDHAPAGTEDGDFNCVRVWGIDKLGDLYLIDGFRHQETMDKTCERALSLIAKYKPFAWFPEDDNNWKSVAPFVTKMMRERRIHCRLEPISPRGGDKAVKAQPFQSMASMGRVWLPQGPMGDDVLNQYLRFPAGKHDDEVDTAGTIGRALDQAHPAIVQAKKVEKPRDRWQESFDRDEDDEVINWKVA